jgi:serine/threonine-protein kinase
MVLPLVFSITTPIEDILYNTAVGRSEQVTDCPDENLVYELVTGKLTDPLARDLQSHAEQCADCRDLIAWVRRDLAPPAEATTVNADAEVLLVVTRSGRADLTGHIIADKYRLGRRLGAGGMGVVYEAVNTWTERRVALKLLHPWYSTDPETVRRFHHEARNASRIAHPNIVDVFDLGQDATDQSLYMVQEFLTGETLRQYCAERARLSVSEAAEILRPIMEALAAAHELGIVHRDVKPENIILSTDRSGQRIPKLIDFGVSKLTEGDLSAMLQTGRAVGTPLYMSPEQLQADKSIDGRTDVWAMGVVLFEVLAGQRPFEAASHAEVAVRILTGELPSLAALAPEVPAPVAAVVARALQRDREARWPSMRAMIDTLAAAIASSDGGEAPAAVATRAPGTRRRWYVGAALVLATASALAIGAARTHRPHAPAAAPAPVTAPPPSATTTTSPIIVAPAPPPIVTATPPPVAPPSPAAAPAPSRRRQRVRPVTPPAPAPTVTAPTTAKHAPILDP